MNNKRRTVCRRFTCISQAECTPCEYIELLLQEAEFRDINVEALGLKYRKSSAEPAFAIPSMILNALADAGYDHIREGDNILIAE